jgi:hypothetical protein
LFYTEIDELQMHGIGVADITKLKTAGICTVRVSYLYLLLENYALKIFREFK